METEPKAFINARLEELQEEIKKSGLKARAEVLANIDPRDAFLIRVTDLNRALLGGGWKEWYAKLSATDQGAGEDLRILATVDPEFMEKALEAWDARDEIPELLEKLPKDRARLKELEGKAMALEKKVGKDNPKFKKVLEKYQTVEKRIEETEERICELDDIYMFHFITIEGEDREPRLLELVAQVYNDFDEYASRLEEPTPEADADEEGDELDGTDEGAQEDGAEGVEAETETEEVDTEESEEEEVEAEEPEADEETQPEPEGDGEEEPEGETDDEVEEDEDEEVDEDEEDEEDTNAQE